MRIALLLTVLLPTVSFAAPGPVSPVDGPELVEIRVPVEQLEECQATLALVMLLPEDTDGPITVETDTGPATFRCVPE